MKVFLQPACVFLNLEAHVNHLTQSSIKIARQSRKIFQRDRETNHARHNFKFWIKSKVCL